MKPNYTVSTRIKKPVAEVFEAVVSKEILTHLATIDLAP